MRSVGPPLMWYVIVSGPSVDVRVKVNEPGVVVGSVLQWSVTPIGVVADTETDCCCCARR